MPEKNEKQLECVESVRLVHNTNQTEKVGKRETKPKKNDELIKSGHGYKNPWHLKETMVEMIYGKDNFWVWSGTENKKIIEQTACGL